MKELIDVFAESGKAVASSPVEKRDIAHIVRSPHHRLILEMTTGFPRKKVIEAFHRKGLLVGSVAYRTW